MYGKDLPKCSLVEAEQEELQGSEGKSRGRLARFSLSSRDEKVSEMEGDKGREYDRSFRLSMCHMFRI